MEIIQKLKREDKYLVGTEMSEDDYQVVEEMFGKLILCPKCIKPLSQYWKIGKRKTRRGTSQDRFRCLRCGYRFTLHSLDFRMQKPEKVILKFIELIEKGWTPYTIVSHKKLKISMGTSFRWRKIFIKQKGGLNSSQP